MGTITIDGRKVEFTDEKNLLTVIRKAGIDIPHYVITRNCPRLEPVVCVR